MTFGAENLPTGLSSKINRLVKFQLPRYQILDLEHFKVSGGFVFSSTPFTSRIVYVCKYIVCIINQDLALARYNSFLEEN